MRREDDDEITIAELWGALRKRQLWLLAGLLCGVVAALGYTTLGPATYESRATIQIGRVYDKATIEELGTLAARLMDQYGAESEDAERKTAHLKRVSQASSKQVAPASDVVRLVATARSPEEVREFLERIVANLLEQHDHVYAGAIRPPQQHLADIEGQIGLMSVQVKQLGTLLARLTESQPVQASLLALERGRLSEELNRLERERLNLQRQIIDSSRSRVISKPTLPQAPASPSVTISLASGIVLGLIIGFFAALIREKYAMTRAAAEIDARHVRGDT